MPLFNLYKDLSSSVFIFKYHEIGYSNTIHYTATEMFAKQVKLISEYFTVISLEQALNIDEKTELSLFKPCAVITFDDGYKGQAEFALPILKELGLPATFFISSGHLDDKLLWNDKLYLMLKHSEKKHLQLTQPSIDLRWSDEQSIRDACLALEGELKYQCLEYREQVIEQISRELEITPSSLPSLMMTKAQLRLLLDSGMTLGGHTKQHPILKQESDVEAKKQIESDKRDLESLLGQDFKFFAYPNGKLGQDFSQVHMEMVEQAGYLASVSTVSTAFLPGLDHRYALPRLSPEFYSSYGVRRLQLSALKKNLTRLLHHKQSNKEPKHD